MRQLYIYMMVAVLFCACYDDKGNYDYITLEECEVTIPDNGWSVAFGETLRIMPTLETTIPENDLSFTWEFQTTGYWKKFVPVYEGKEMNFVCVTDDELITKDGVYQLRLTVTQVSNGRKFYSNMIPVEMYSGQQRVLGAMVLHGDGNTSDIGMISAPEFRPAGNADTQESVFPHYYSNANDGDKIEGRGRMIIQSYIGSSDYYPDNIAVIALTDKSSVVTESTEMKKTGDWQSLFYGNLNQGVPQTCFTTSYNFFAMDGGDIFRKQAMKGYFTAPEFEADGAEYLFAPQVLDIPNYNGGLAFDMKSRGFFSIGGYPNSFTDFTSINSGTGSVVPFNPADMNANLIYMDVGGITNHVLAVMQPDDGSPYMVEMDVLADNYAQFPLYVYNLDHLSDVQQNNIVDWAFGSSYMNMCYYATPVGVYRFSADAGKTIAPEALRMTDGSPLKLEGKVTMMKLMKPAICGTYPCTNTILAVATYGGTTGSGKLYSLTIDPFSGYVASVKSYTGFDEIYDINIKGY